jgi:hypothetical protein
VDIGDKGAEHAKAPVSTADSEAVAMLIGGNRFKRKQSSQKTKAAPEYSTPAQLNYDNDEPAFMGGACVRGVAVWGCICFRCGVCVCVWVGGGGGSEG